MHEIDRALETVERDSLADVFAAAPAAARASLGLHAERAGSGLVVCARAVGDPTMNRLLGLELDDGVTEETVALAVARLRERALGRFFVQVHPDAGPDGRWDRWLAGCGLVRYPRGWMRLVRGREALPPTTGPGELRVRRLDDPRDAALFGELFTAGYGLPAATAAFVGAVVGRPRWRCYVALDGERPIATGALFVDGRSAWLGFGATLPEARRMGAQSTLIRARVADALDLGCTLVTSETGEPVAGKPNPSGDNLQRQGFRVRYVRPNWVAA